MAIEPETSPAPSPSVDVRKLARRVGANELGAIPVLMYHRITQDDPGEFDRTPRAFRAELRRLHAEGYRPITTLDLVRGNIDLPAGTSPVVLTFDDSSPSQFAFEGGRPDPDTAVGILLDFSRTHPEWEPAASFYVNQRPFASDQWQRMLRFLVERGFEIGNHSYSHAHLGSLSAAGVRRELALGAELVRDATGEDARTLALPLGIMPDPPSLVRRGSWNGVRYRHGGVLLVGAGPAPSPFSRSFDPFAIPRIRSSAQPRGEAPNFSSEYWLDHLRDNPERRFVSDGDPATITFPHASRAEIARRFADKALSYRQEKG